MDQDIKLYNQFISGNKEAFEKIMDKYRLNLIYFIRRFVKSIDIAEDIAQDVFVYVLINKKEYDFKYSLKTYLYTIAKCRALNFLRKEKKLTLIDEPQMYSDESIDDLDQEILLNERKNNLKKAINKLSSKYQIVIYLADIDSFNYKEICKILNKSMPQVKMLIYRARKSLANILKKEAKKYEE